MKIPAAAATEANQMEQGPSAGGFGQSHFKFVFSNIHISQMVDSAAASRFLVRVAMQTPLHRHSTQTGTHESVLVTGTQPVTKVWPSI